MFGLDDLAEGIIGGPLALAAAAVVVVLGAPRAKPLAKQAIKGYLAGTQRAREWAAEATEQWQDLVAEAKYEYESELRAEDVPAVAAPAAPRSARKAAESVRLSERPA